MPSRIQHLTDRVREQLDPFSTSHDRASEMYAVKLRGHPQLPDRESRLCELIEYYGWEIGHRGQFATPWFYYDDERGRAYVRQLGVEPMQFQILHMYSLFNRMDPDRPDFYHLFDGCLERLESLGGPQEVAVLDFGTGLGQIGLSFALAGYPTVLSERVPDFLDFVGFLARNRGLSPEFHLAESDDTFYDTGADGRKFGLVVEWSAFEHVANTLQALENITHNLVPGGMFVTTTFKKDWTPEAMAHYRRDSQDDSIADQYLDPKIEAWLDERFTVLSPARTIAKVLVRR
jgi:2-polyprenyl-3-methyl-5-hydroxy-6-metoxy-1,4-benzoquinol methylase